MKTKKIHFTKAIFAVALATSLIILNMSFTERSTRGKKISGCNPFIATGTIKGRVFIEGRKTAVALASVELFEEKTLVNNATSGDHGTFVLANIPVGTYKIKVTKTGYDIFYSGEIDVEAGKTTIFNIGLRLLESQIKKELEIVEDAEEIQEILLVEPSLQIISPEGDMKRSYSQAVTTIGKGVSGADLTNYISHNTESYDKINENNFKEVVNNPLSTFSIDVDRASYSNVRRFLNMNKMPYKDAVRIEEMINYFDYDYPQPDNGDPFSVNIELGSCPWNKKHEIMMIGIQGEEITTGSIPAGNIVFLIDVSGSMGSPEKLPLLKQAFKILVNNLRSEDKVAIVVYAGAAGCVLESTPGKDKNKILSALDRLHSGGSTAGGAGIKLAYKIAKENFIPGGNNRVILATDGDFNIGASSNGEMVRLIEEKRKDGIFLSILGFGMGNYKDSKMEQISNAGNGNYAYIDNIMEAKKVFGEELWGTLYTIAKDVKIQIEFNPAKVRAYRLIGYENRILNNEDFNDDKKDAGDIGSGHTVTALYELVLTCSDEKFANVDPLEYQSVNVGNSSNLMTLKLRYKDTEESTSKLIVIKVNADDVRESNVSDNFNFAAAVAEFGMLLRNSEYKKNSSYRQTLALAKQAKGKDEFGYRTEFIKMVETAELLSK